MLEHIAQELAGTSAVEFAAVVLALAYVVLAVRRSQWCWPAAFVSAALFLGVFIGARLYMQAALQSFYMAMAVYGFLEWRRGRDDSGALAIATRSPLWHGAAALAICAATAVNGWLLARGGGAAAPYVDAFVTWSSILTTWLVARRVLENWLYWIVIDAVAVTLYYSRGLAFTAMLFVLYIALAARGYFAWRAEWRRQHASPADGGLLPATADESS